MSSKNTSNMEERIKKFLSKYPVRSFIEIIDGISNTYLGTNAIQVREILDQMESRKIVSKDSDEKYSLIHEKQDEFLENLNQSIDRNNRRFIEIKLNMIVNSLERSLNESKKHLEESKKQLQEFEKNLQDTVDDSVKRIQEIKELLSELKI